MPGQEIPEFAREAIVACQVLTNLGETESEEEDLAIAKDIAKHALKTFIEEVSAGTIRVHLSKGGE